MAWIASRITTTPVSRLCTSFYTHPRSRACAGCGMRKFIVGMIYDDDDVV